MSLEDPPTPQPASLMSERTFGRTMIGSLILGFVILAAVVITAGWLLVRGQEYTRLVEHTYLVESRLADFRVTLERVEAARRGYLLSGDERYLVTYRTRLAMLEPVQGDLRRLTADNPSQQQRLDRLKPLVSDKLSLLDQSVDLRRKSGVIAGVLAFERPQEQALLDQIRTLADQMTGAEQALLAQRSQRQISNARLLVAVVALAGVLLALIAAASTWVMRRYARDLTRSQAELRKLNEGLEDAVRARTADLSRANEEIQRFAYIVSHDLRSPLVNIMGFTSELEVSAKALQKLVDETAAHAPELLSAEARLAVEVDLPESVGFIRASTQKMDRLISAILKLSREGRRTLNPEPLVADDLVMGVIQTMRRQIDDRSAEVSIEGRLPDLIGDRVALEQVFSNLIENALKYLKPGRPGVIAVRGHIQAGRVIYEVQDNGRGIDPKDHERIFELFRRAGVQDQTGEGIGLAHVRALVYRLGGLIDCVSALDQGATFRLFLPRILIREGA